MTDNRYSTSETDVTFMRRALELATRGAGFVSPNPMVGAVITAPDNRIIGEGWHRVYGGPHAEVNAIASVKAEDEHLLPLSTIYVSLEPCSHYGKTPPCSKLIIEKKIRRVVVGMGDPFKEVCGRGIKMLREAGIEVVEKVLEKECLALNRRFVTAHTLRRPFIQLKWAQSADNFIGAFSPSGYPCPVSLSNPLSLVEMHRERSLADAILIGTDTVISDNPTLTTRLWPGNSPRPVLFASDRIPAHSAVMARNPIILDPSKSLEENLSDLYSIHKITSLMVEGGAKTLKAFINASLFDEIRVETAPIVISHGIPAPTIPTGLATLIKDREIRGNNIRCYKP